MLIDLEVWRLIDGDAQRYIDHGEISPNWCKNIWKWKFYLCANAVTVRNHCLAFLFWWRILSFEIGGGKVPYILRVIAKSRLKRISSIYGLQIPLETQIGEALYIGHGIGIVINPKTIIGNHCNISHFLTIGSNKNTPAIIGNNVYIGPGVSIVEDVKIGNNVKIGAGTVVINDIPDNATSVGNPNRIIKK